MFFQTIDAAISTLNSKLPNYFKFLFNFKSSQRVGSLKKDFGKIRNQKKFPLNLDNPITYHGDGRSFQLLFLHGLVNVLISC